MSSSSVSSEAVSNASSYPESSLSSSASSSLSNSNSSSVIATERMITLSPELSLAALCYGDPNSSLKILGVHGWVDNAATFELIVPMLIELGYYVVNIDLPGHGKSYHRPPSCYYSAIEYAANVLEVLENLQWENCVLMGHSLGGGICTVIASVLKTHIKGLILIDNLGLSYRPVEDTSKYILTAVQSKRSLARKNESSFYNSIEDAINQRIHTATTHPGNQHISREGAERLVLRALIPVDVKVETTYKDGSSSTITQQKYKFRHDRRIYALDLQFIGKR